MANLTLDIRFDTAHTISLIDSAVWAVEHGVLTDKEAVEVLVEDLIGGMKVIPRVEEHG